MSYRPLDRTAKSTTGNLLMKSSKSQRLWLETPVAYRSNTAADTYKSQAIGLPGLEAQLAIRNFYWGTERIAENHHQRKCFESKETNKRDNMYVPWLHNSRGRHQSINFKTFDRHLRRSAPSRGSPRKTWAAVGPKLTLRRWASLPFVAGSNLSGKQHDATTTECCRI